MIAEMKVIIYGVIFSIIAILGGYVYAQTIAIDTLDNKVQSLTTDLQNQKLILKLCRTDCEVEKFEKVQEVTVKKEKEKPYEKVPDAIGNHTISFE